MTTMRLCSHCGVRPVAPSATKPAARCLECRAYFHEKAKGHWVTLTCAQCGNEFEGPKIRKYCGAECTKKAQGPMLAKLARGEKSRTWRGGRRICSYSGYVLVLDTDYDNRKNGSRYVGEHRLVMAEVLGRDLHPWEVVHHKNGVKTDNRPENLEIWINGHPGGQRADDLPPHCPTCTCFQTKI